MQFFSIMLEHISRGRAEKSRRVIQVAPSQWVMQMEDRIRGKGTIDGSRIRILNILLGLEDFQFAVSNQAAASRPMPIFFFTPIEGL
jgi:hypothetical protein